MATRKSAEKSARERLTAWLSQHRAQFPTNASFAARCQISEGRLSQILSGDLPSVRLAMRIQAATGNAIATEDWFKNLTLQAVRA